MAKAHQLPHLLLTTPQHQQLLVHPIHHMSILVVYVKDNLDFCLLVVLQFAGILKAVLFSMFMKNDMVVLCCKRCE
jgi:hypothetical protein